MPADHAEGARARGRYRTARNCRPDDRFAAARTRIWGYTAAGAVRRVRAHLVAAGACRGVRRARAPAD